MLCLWLCQRREDVVVRWMVAVGGFGGGGAVGDRGGEETSGGCGGVGVGVGVGRVGEAGRRGGENMGLLHPLAPKQTTAIFIQQSSRKDK